MTRRIATAGVVAVASLVLAARADAHRLDEYLQASRLSIDAGRVGVELELSPGVAVADCVVQVIDRDRDGRIDDGEADAYAAAVAAALTLSIDGHTVPLHVDGRAFASPDAMRDGVGAIRLTLSAPVTMTNGRHRIVFTNTHLPAVSAYLVNAFVPSDARISLGAPARDPLQRTFTMDYDVRGSRGWMGWSGAAFAMVAMLIAGRRRRR